MLTMCGNCYERVALVLGRREGLTYPGPASLTAAQFIEIARRQTQMPEGDNTRRESDMTCDVCGAHAVTVESETLESERLEDCELDFDPSREYQISLCPECAATRENPGRLIPQAFEEWNEWYHHAVSDSMDSPVAI